MTLKDKILKHPAVQGLEKDDDEWGYWCYLKTNYIYPEMECSLIHEQTLSIILNCLKYVKERKNNAGYIKRFLRTDEIPANAIYIRSFDKVTAFCPHSGQVYKSRTVYEFYIPNK